MKAEPNSTARCRTTHSCITQRTTILGSFTLRSLPDETKETASAFMLNAIAALPLRAFGIQRVLTDNGAFCRRSRAFAAVLAEAGIIQRIQSGRASGRLTTG